jgi:WD40-like Beta Propeller Repeat
VQWAELKLPVLQEAARPYLTQVEPEGSDLWRAYVVRGASAPVPVVESRRYLREVFWHGGSTLTFSYLTRLEGTSAQASVSGLWQYSLTASTTTWEQTYEVGFWPTPSPDGSHIALLNHTANGLYIQEAGGRVWELGSPGSAPAFYGWSPDGRAFAFRRGTPGSREERPSYVKYVAALGEDKALALGGGTPAWSPGGEIASWSPDGEKLAVLQRQEALIVDFERRTEQRVPLATYEPRPDAKVWNTTGDYVSHGDALIDVEAGRVLYGGSRRVPLASAVSADGRWQAFINGTICGNASTPGTELRLREVRSGTESTLVRCSDLYFTSLEWLESGKLVALGPQFATENRSYHVALIDPSGGRVQQLTQGPEFAAAYHLSPDRKRILVTGTRLRVYTMDGVLEREIVPPDEQPVTAAAWSPDGSSFAYIVSPKLQFP